MSTSSFKETVNTSLRYHKISFSTFEPGVRTYKTGKIRPSRLHYTVLLVKGCINESFGRFGLKTCVRQIHYYYYYYTVFIIRQKSNNEICICACNVKSCKCPTSLQCTYCNNRT